ncbi:hypothetical protein GOP47_0030985 [Adiantum capillus-veneris]|nr:hypothetical protein GOP47_0030985 [Adiantum capillus-veneris]
MQGCESISRSNEKKLGEEISRDAIQIGSLADSGRDKNKLGLTIWTVSFTSTGRPFSSWQSPWRCPLLPSWAIDLEARYWAPMKRQLQVPILLNEQKPPLHILVALSLSALHLHRGHKTCITQLHVYRLVEFTGGSLNGDA